MTAPRPALRSITLALLLGLSIAGCAKKAPKSLPPDPGPATTVEGTDGANQGAVPGSQADFVQQLMGQDTIYFDTDRFNIDSPDMAALQAQAQWLAKYPAKRATIEGHCDERGTVDYNLALGEQRARATRDYLVSLGVAGDRLTAVSYGKERPLDPASNEAAWAKNRRAHFLASR